MAFKRSNLTSAPCFSKPQLSFSIERILGKKNEESTIPGHFQPGALSSMPRGDQTSCQADTSDINTMSSDLPWLAYTRYSPPKIPRIRKPMKRKTSGNPRVPFSTSQLMTLETKYMEARYLSGPEVSDLSSSLNLSEHRVKIWFQNRRAREKKTQHKKGQPSLEIESGSSKGQTPEVQSDCVYLMGQNFTHAFFAFGLGKYRLSPS